MRFEFNDDSQKICNSVDVVNYGIQCDICGNKVLSVSNINGKRYCAGCYYKTFMKDNQKAEIDQLKQENETLFLQLSKQEVDEHKPAYCTLAGNDCKYLGKVEELKQQLAEKDCRIEELEGQFAYECECNMQLVDLQKQLEEKQKTIDEINREFVQAVHDWKALCAEKDKEIAHLKEKDNYHLRYELAGADETITNLKQQLEEKDKLLKCYQEEEKLIADILGDKDLTLIGSRVHLKNLIVELKNKIKDKDIVIEEKDKEISRLKERLSVIDNFKDNYGYTNYDDREILEDLQSRAFQAEDDTQVVDELLQFFNIFDENELVDKVKEPQTQLAIQQLEKVKELVKDKSAWSSPFGLLKIQESDVEQIIDQQIKELKGEKNGTRN